MQLKTLHKVPWEVWNLISKEFSSFELRELVPYGRNMTNKEELHESIWHKVIGEDQTWLDAMTARGLNPALIGRDLHRPTYMCLVVNDWSGDAQYENEKLFSSLQSKSRLKGYEIELEGGITLNLFDVLHNPMYIEVKPYQLFKGKRPSRLRAQYVYWKDKSFQVGRINHKDIRPCPWMKGKPLLRPSNKHFECEVTLPLPKHHLPKRRPNKLNFQATEHPRDALGG